MVVVSMCVGGVSVENEQLGIADCSTCGAFAKLTILQHDLVLEDAVPVRVLQRK